MAKRTQRRSGERCPCGLPKAYQECCGLFHGGQPAPTAQLLMRSRFTAFAVTDDAYLLRTWHPATRPARIRFDPGHAWLRLHILETTGGGLLDPVGTVDFRADYRTAGELNAVRENSRFVRHGGLWVYVGAVSAPFP